MVKTYVAVPEFITVHLGPPDSAAENVTVSFPEYIKNVASSEIYPTWPENAIQSFAGGNKTVETEVSKK